MKKSQTAECVLIALSRSICQSKLNAPSEQQAMRTINKVAQKKKMNLFFAEELLLKLLLLRVKKICNVYIKVISLWTNQMTVICSSHVIIVEFKKAAFEYVGYLLVVRSFPASLEWFWTLVLQCWKRQCCKLYLKSLAMTIAIFFMRSLFWSSWNNFSSKLPQLQFEVASYST